RRRAARPPPAPRAGRRPPREAGRLPPEGAGARRRRLVGRGGALGRLRAAARARPSRRGAEGGRQGRTGRGREEGREGGDEAMSSLIALALCCAFQVEPAPLADRSGDEVAAPDEGVSVALVSKPGEPETVDVVAHGA